MSEICHSFCSDAETRDEGGGGGIPTAVAPALLLVSFGVSSVASFLPVIVALKSLDEDFVCHFCFESHPVLK